MHDVKDTLCCVGISTLLLTLAGHGEDDIVVNITADTWRNDFSHAFASAKTKAQDLGVKLLVVCHSMGCLLASCHFAYAYDDLDGVAGCASISHQQTACVYRYARF